MLCVAALVPQMVSIEASRTVLGTLLGALHATSANSLGIFIASKLQKRLRSRSHTACKRLEEALGAKEEPSHNAHEQGESPCGTKRNSRLPLDSLGQKKGSVGSGVLINKKHQFPQYMYIIYMCVYIII